MLSKYRKIGLLIGSLLTTVGSGILYMGCETNSKLEEDANILKNVKEELEKQKNRNKEVMDLIEEA